MRKVIVGLAVFAALTAQASAGVWESNCAGCHNGSVAQSTAEVLKKKFKTKQEFINAAKNTTNPMMAGIKANPQLIEEAAKELYGK
ncbi:hypothetical protein [Phorcysia thermohydrogeniphila]|uniref:Cytochrome c domain-containing protein n=1 Tax=Phorcysia thermohydrogeniphila TaxID=936138 RepID=A0A4R1G784_9BACT|nr:hypothetical protein [Phorcysia thermohydrogeniphila]TCK03378.1 hypothetical protein CLV27_1452 [Phorcysia thermohydrogeniphila]